LKLETEGMNLKREGDAWYVLNSAGQGVGRGEVVVIANAHEAGRFVNGSFLSLRTLKGQILSISPVASLASLRSVLVFENYLILASDAFHVLGATFEHRDRTEHPTPQATETLLASWNRWFPHLTIENSSQVQARAALRSVTA